MPALAARPVLPPEEKFWRRYSPRHEFPLAMALSIFAHGLILGIILLLALGWFLGNNQSDILRPLNMDAVILDSSGDGIGGFGVPGAPADNKTEITQLKDSSKENISVSKSIGPSTPPDNILTTTPDFNPAEQDNLDKEFALIGKEADKAAKEPDPKKDPKTLAKVKMPGVGEKGKSSGDPGGIGMGGKGTKFGVGKGGPGGVGGADKLTMLEVYARRWRFDLSGEEANEHVDKLVNVGFVVVVRDFRGNYYFLQDLRRRPVELKRGDLGPLKEAVKFWNQSPQSKQKLVKELRIPFEPKEVILFFPKEREQKLAAEEARFARSQGRDPAQIRETWFDFVLQDGVYEPKVKSQN